MLAIGARPATTPAFILLRDGAEAGRLEGFTGRAAFRPALRRLLSTAGAGS